MTTHERQMSTAQPDQMPSAEPQQQMPPARTERTSSEQPVEPAPSAAEDQARDTGTPAAPADDQAIDDNTLLFADEHRSGLRSRWDEVQAAFVDDPKQCVQKADNLVAEVVEQLTASFADTRSRLEAQWARGEDASTEDLRLALKRYRDFFQRLLSV